MVEIRKVLFELANALQPVVAIGLLALIGWSLVLLGGAAREKWERMREPDRRTRQFAQRMSDESADLETARRELDRIELALVRRVESAGFAARLGPMFGLAGTLIPLGPALRDFGAGDSSGFADNLVLAFATTVAGLLVSGLCLWVSALQGRWFEEDLRGLDDVVRRVAR